MFGRRRRQAAAAREAERTALFARLAERPDHICPFLGLSNQRTAYLDGVSDEHRCFASTDPVPLSAEQQTRVCQQRGYGNCPRYLRGVLVIPSEELDALRRPTRPAPAAAPPPRRPARRERSRLGSFLLAALVIMLFGIAGTGATYLVVTGGGPLVGGLPADPTPSLTPSPRPSRTPRPTPSVDASSSPTPEPTPTAGDVFAYYEVWVAPGDYTLFRGSSGELEVGFDDSSFARVEPREDPDGDVEWVTLDGELAGWAYRAPESGNFRIRAVFFDESGSRSAYDLDDEDIRTMPEATPAPAP